MELIMFQETSPLVWLLLSLDEKELLVWVLELVV
jgi:hypothetical protein